jgi:hypothetical protein
MFRESGAPVARAKQRVNNIVVVGVPFKGLNTRSPYGSMLPNEAIALNNVIVESVGIRTRKGYTEWCTALPGTAAPAVRSILSYYPATYSNSPQARSDFYTDISKVGVTAPLSNSGTGPGQVFAAQESFIYDVTAGGTGPFVPEAGVAGLTAYWNGVNYQNIAGNFLLIANEGGGYAIYDGTSWTMPSFGVGAGQVGGVNPANIAWVTTWKDRVWFIERDTTFGWYLPPGQITGVATQFDFGTQMDHGGDLRFLGGWTVDGGVGTDDYLVAIGSQGDVVIYKGTDPDDSTTFTLHGVWYSGPLPAGRRAVEASGGDINILTQFGLMPISKLLQPTHLAAQFQQHLSYNIDPLIAVLMRQYSTLSGWQIISLAKEELILIRLPELIGTAVENSWIAYKTTTQTWSILSSLPYSHITNIGHLAYAGTLDGRIVRAFEGPLDNALLDGTLGLPIKCRVTPAYNDLGAPGLNKILLMVRPFFLSYQAPSVKLLVLANYSTPEFVIVPTVPEDKVGDLWDVGRWDVGRWGGQLNPLHSWFGCQGWGHVITVQLDYITTGDTLLTGLDYWIGKGGVM